MEKALVKMNNESQPLTQKKSAERETGIRVKR